MADPRSISNGTCFSAQEEEASRNFIPCGNSDYGYYHCCQAGDFCLGENACFNDKHGTTYLAGCTDSDYKNPACPDKKAWKDYPWAGLIYCKPNRWIACKEANKPTVITNGNECTCPPNDEMTVAFSAPPQITAIASLPSRLGGTIEWQEGHLPTGEPTPRTTEGSQTTISSSTISMPFSTSGSSFTSSTPTSTTTPIIDHSPQNEGMSDGVKAGIGIGAAVGAMLLFGALSAFWMVFRRRRNDEESPFSPEAVLAGPSGPPGQSTMATRSEKFPSPVEMPSPVAHQTVGLSELPMGPWVVRPELQGDASPTGSGYEPPVSAISTPSWWSPNQAWGAGVPLSPVGEGQVPNCQGHWEHNGHNQGQQVPGSGQHPAHHGGIRELPA